MSINPSIYRNARENYIKLINQIIERWPKFKGREKPKCCLLSLDERIQAIDTIISEYYSPILVNLTVEVLGNDEHLNKIWDEYLSKISQAPRYKDLVARQFGLLLALSHINNKSDLLTKIYEITEGVSYTFLDMAESIMVNHVLSRGVVAYMYLYGSARFREAVIDARVRMKKKGQDYDKVHENMTKKIAPALAAVLSAHNLITDAIGKLADSDRYPTLSLLALKKLAEKATITTGIGSTLAKALFRGLASGTTQYVYSFLVSVMLANGFLLQMWDLAPRMRGREYIQEAITKYKNESARLRSALGEAPKQWIKDLEIYYELSDAIKDAWTVYLINVVSEKADEREINNALRLID